MRIIIFPQELEVLHVLHAGDCFQFEGNTAYYIKTSAVKDRCMGVVDLYEGSVKYVDPESRVVKIDATIRIAE